MKEMGLVYGSERSAAPIIIGKDTVYVHTEIKECVDDKKNKIWQYNEVQYDKNEYILLMAKKSAEYEEIINTMLGANQTNEEAAKTEMPVMEEEFDNP